MTQWLSDSALASTRQTALRVYYTSLLSPVCTKAGNRRRVNKLNRLPMSSTTQVNLAWPSLRG